MKLRDQKILLDLELLRLLVASTTKANDPWDRDITYYTKNGTAVTVGITKSGRRTEAKNQAPLPQLTSPTLIEPIPNTKAFTDINTSSALLSFAEKTRIDIGTVQPVAEGIEQEMAELLDVSPPEDKPPEKESFGNYLNKQFTDFQDSYNSFVESDNVKNFKDNLGKFVKAAAPVATTIAFALAPELLIPVVTGQAIVWSSALVSAGLGTAIYYATEKGLDALKVENTWVRIGASIVTGLMVGGGISALKKNLGKKANVLKCGSVCEELAQVKEISEELEQAITHKNIDKIIEIQKNNPELKKKLFQIPNLPVKGEAGLNPVLTIGKVKKLSGYGDVVLVKRTKESILIARDVVTWHPIDWLTYFPIKPDMDYIVKNRSMFTTSEILGKVLDMERLSNGSISKKGIKRILGEFGSLTKINDPRIMDEEARLWSEVVKIYKLEKYGLDDVHRFKLQDDLPDDWRYEFTEFLKQQKPRKYSYAGIQYKRDPRTGGLEVADDPVKFIFDYKTKPDKLPLGYEIVDKDHPFLEFLKYKKNVDTKNPILPNIPFALGIVDNDMDRLPINVVNQLSDKKNGFFSIFTKADNSIGYKVTDINTKQVIDIKGMEEQLEHSLTNMRTPLEPIYYMENAIKFPDYFDIYKQHSQEIETGAGKILGMGVFHVK